MTQHPPDSPSQVVDLADLDLPQMEATFAARGLQGFRARQIFAWIYRRGVTDIDAMTDLPRDLRASLAADCTITTPVVASHERRP